MNCPICENPSIERVYFFSHTPAVLHKLYYSREDALKALAMDFDLWGCPVCGFVFNKAYEFQKDEFSYTYNNRQDLSPYVKSYLLNLAQELIAKYDLTKKKMAEVGCGKGYWLETFYDLGVKNIQGFDPTYVSRSPVIDKLVRVEFFNQKNVAEKYDFIFSRQVLEYFKNPREHIAELRECLEEGGAMFFEVPDLDPMLKNESFFDFFYEHFSYFSKSSLQQLLYLEGFFDVSFNSLFSGQYLGVEAKRGNEKTTPPPFLALDFRKITRFMDEKISYCKQLVGDVPKPFAVWGAGAKGITFLNRLAIDYRDCPYVIDINSGKQNTFVPITGQRIVSPDILAKEDIKTIIILNPAYEKEIKDMALGYNYQGRFVVF